MEIAIWLRCHSPLRDRLLGKSYRLETTVGEQSMYGGAHSFSCSKTADFKDANTIVVTVRYDGAGQCVLPLRLQIIRKATLFHVEMR